jgi:hypothetical protein
LDTKLIMMNETELEIIYINPFGEVVHEGKVVNVKKVVVEATRSESQMKELLSHNEVLIENEWYVLFLNGTLIEKGRSKVRSSDYLIGKKHVDINNYYEVL